MTSFFIPKHYLSNLSKLATAGQIVGRISRVDGSLCTVLTADGFRRASPAGHGPLAVGDWVLLRELPQVAAELQVQRLLPRTSVFARQAAGRRGERQLVAANVDVLFIVSGLDGDVSARRFERYIAAARASPATPVILLTKLSQCSDFAAIQARLRARVPDVDVLAMDTLDGIGTAQLDHYRGPGRSLAFVGSSGVGKSTLINHLLRKNVMATHTVRARDARGQHTTTHRELHLLADGTAIIDTPGMREFGLTDEHTDLEAGFAELENIVRGCRFRNCTHVSEPGCAVLAALRDGQLSEERWASYTQLSDELQADRKQSVKRQRREAERSFGRELARRRKRGDIRHR